MSAKAKRHVRCEGETTGWRNEHDEWVRGPRCRNLIAKSRAFKWKRANGKHYCPQHQTQGELDPPELSDEEILELVQSAPVVRPAPDDWKTRVYDDDFYRQKREMLARGDRCFFWEAGHEHPLCAELAETLHHWQYRGEACLVPICHYHNSLMAHMRKEVDWRKVGVPEPTTASMSYFMLGVAQGHEELREVIHQLIEENDELTDWAKEGLRHMPPEVELEMIRSKSQRRIARLLEPYLDVR